VVSDPDASTPTDGAPDTPAAGPRHHWLAAVCDGTELGALVLDTDWASTPLGPPETWSTALRTAVGICLTSRFPMLVVWGPDLVKIYNDGYRAILGTEKHPKALGAPAREIWPEIWHLIGPEFDEVMATGRATWHEHEMLVLERNGFPEECFFVWGYSPLFDDDGSIGGVLDVVTETTPEVLARRRMACVTALGAALFEAEQVTDVCVRAALALSGSTPDLGAVDVYLRIGDEMVLMASNRRENVAPVPSSLLLEVAGEHRPVVIGGTVGDAPAAHYVVPLTTARGGIDGALVASLNPQRPFDDAYAAFVHLVGSAVAAALDSAYRRATEVGEYREIADTLQSALLPPSNDLPTVATRYLPAVGNLAVGGDWYDVLDLDDNCRALVVGDCVGHGLQAATVMGQLRSAARMMLMEGRDPAATLQGLDAFAATIPGASCATVTCAVVNRSAGTITYSSAGHPPTLVVDAHGARWLVGATATPLAVGSPERVNATESLAVGDVIVLYSDGLVERRGEPIDVGLERLAAAATALHGDSVQRIADELLRRLSPENTRDDVVLVVKSFEAV
jgi:hypothetical protein